MPIHKTRDNSFKLIFGNHELFVEFLRDFIPIDILKDVKPEAIEDISERFLPLFQEGRDSDTVKRISLKDGGAPLFVIAVVEHESKVNYRAGFKMLQYICLILDQYEKEVNREHPGIIQTKDFSYPPVLPVIFYDGPETWTAPLNFADRTEMCGIFAKYVPGFEYLLVELNRYSQEDRVHQFFPCAFFASQKTGLSASIFWLCQKDLRCNPWRGPGASGDFARKKLVHPGRPYPLWRRPIVCYDHGQAAKAGRNRPAGEAAAELF